MPRFCWSAILLGCVRYRIKRHASDREKRSRDRSNRSSAQQRSWRSLPVLALTLFSVSAAESLNIGDQRELFVDGYLIDELKNARQVLHEPQPREKVLGVENPWEGIYSAYYTVLRDGQKFRMYYRGMPEAKHDLDTDVTCYADIIFTSSRGGDDFPRTFMEAFIRPGLDPRNWTSRANYAAHGFLSTGPNEISIYVSHNVGYPTSHIRRYTLRTDGFVSINGPYSGGELITKPLTFEGGKLTVNYSTSAAGGIRVALETPDHQPILGFTVEDCPEIIGDEIDHTVTWSAGNDVSALSGKPVRIQFLLKDADLFSLRFVP